MPQGGGFDVVTIGSAVQDVFVISKKLQKIQSSAFEGGSGECLAVGSKNEIDDLEFMTGGGATNAAATFAHLGLATGCMAEVGDDEAARNLKKEFRAFGITDFTHTHANKKTGYSVILASPGADRAILTYRGASAEITMSHFPLNKVRTKWFYVTSLHGNIAGMETILTRAEAIGAHVAWNPGMAEVAIKISHLKPILERIHLLNVNREEAMALTGNYSPNIDDQLRRICDLVEYTCITDGGNGAWLTTDSQAWHVKTNPVKIKNTTGAGDAFGSALVAGLIKYKNPVKSLQLAMLNAQSVIQNIGAKTGILKRLPSEKELEKVRVVSW